MDKLILILGGARSGKSTFAERLAAQQPSVAFLATAAPGDEEMRRRIEIHRRDRPPGWRTIEEPLAVPEAVATAAEACVIIDCLTLWLSNLLLACGEEQADRLFGAVDRLIAVAAARPGLVVVVSNEVGLGLVPATALGRTYRDLLGRANQRLAAAADEVYLLVAGLPVELKRLLAAIGAGP